MSTETCVLSASSLARLRGGLALLLWRAEAVRVDFEQPFELASGNRSPVYVNCRQVISDPEFMQLFAAIARLLCRVEGIEIDAIAGGETAGIPFAAYLAQSLGKPMLYVRKKAKGYGIASKVEGRLEQGARVLLVEDLITDGGSKLGFVEALQEAGGRVENVLVLFDRQQGGAELMAEQGLRLHSVVDRATAFIVGEECGLLTAAERSSVDDYFAAPERWHRDRGLTFRSA